MDVCLALHSGNTSVSRNCHSFTEIASAYLDLTTVLTYILVFRIYLYTYKSLWVKPSALLVYLEIVSYIQFHKDCQHSPGSDK